MGVDIITVFNPKEEIDYKPTNADRIRSFSDEELAKFLFEFQISLCCPDNIKSNSGFFDWLQQPAE